MKIILFLELRDPCDRTVYYTNLGKLLKFSGLVCPLLNGDRNAYSTYFISSVSIPTSNEQKAEQPKAEQDHLSELAWNDEEVSEVTHTKRIIQPLDNAAHLVIH